MLVFVMVRVYSTYDYIYNPIWAVVLREDIKKVKCYCRAPMSYTVQYSSSTHTFNSDNKLTYNVNTLYFTLFFNLPYDVLMDWEIVLASIKAKRTFDFAMVTKRTC